MSKVKKQDGFVALTSVVIIAVILMAVTLSLSFTGFYSRFNILTTDYKERSFSLAEACAETALLKLALDTDYAGSETIAVEGHTCEILPISESAGEITIKTKAYFPASGAERTVTNLVIVAGSANLNIISWEEVPNHT